MKLIRKAERACETSQSWNLTTYKVSTLASVGHLHSTVHRCCCHNVKTGISWHSVCGYVLNKLTVSFVLPDKQSDKFDRLASPTRARATPSWTTGATWQLRRSGVRGYYGLLQVTEDGSSPAGCSNVSWIHKVSSGILPSSWKVCADTVASVVIMYLWCFPPSVGSTGRRHGWW